MSTVHLAGAAIVTHGRAIQRCSICGVMLIDSVTPINLFHGYDHFPSFHEGAVVALEGITLTVLEPRTYREQPDRCYKSLQ